MSYRDELVEILGAEWVSDDADTLEEYSKDFSFVTPRRPDVVVKPGNADEVQEVIKWANEKSCPLIPVSSKPPRFRGDTIPRMGGVVVDLERMDKVVRINRRNRVCYIEPGVTYGDLVPALDKEGLRLSTPLQVRAGKSVIATTLEREPIMAPRHHWDIMDPMCTAEVVFGSGEMFRTGEAAGPGGPEAQWDIGGAQKFPLGPHQIDYHRLIGGAQGTMGIATWASIKAELKPSIQKLFYVPAKKLEDLEDFAYKLMKLDLGEELFILDSLTLASILSEDSKEIAERRAKLPSWCLVYVIAGFERYPEDRVDYQEKDAAAHAQRFGLTPAPSVPGAGAGEMLKAINSVSDEPYYKLRYKGMSHDIFFITTLDRAGKYIKVMAEAADEAGFPFNDIGMYIQPVVQGTSCQVQFTLMFDPEDDASVEAAKKLDALAPRKLMAAEAFFARPYGTWANEVYSQNAEYVAALRKVKNVFDPRNVMNPGKLCF